jgi:hypothetical protein
MTRDAGAGAIGMTLEIVGAGLGRTGTLSLKAALEQLGFVRCYHMRDVIEDPARAQAWVEADKGHPDWERIFDGYRATVDYPGCSYWRELIDVYPDAKMLLSVRDPDKWFDSTSETIFSPEWIRMCRESPMGEFFERTVFRDFGERIHNRAFMTGYFRDHVEAVKAAVPPERLLIYEVAQGWQPLCDFFGVAVPDSPFPKVNSREEINERRRQAAESGGGVTRMGEMLREETNGS